jgi:hypothetical protein
MTFVAPLLGIALGSCSLSVSLAVENETGRPVTISFDKTTVNLQPGNEHIFGEWPSDKVVVVKTENCIRMFDLDENYSPANEWRDSRFRIVRRYTVFGDGFLRVKMPDRDHISSHPSALPPKRLALSPISEKCSVSRVVATTLQTSQALPLTGD